MCVRFLNFIYYTPRKQSLGFFSLKQHTVKVYSTYSKVINSTNVCRYFNDRTTLSMQIIARVERIKNKSEFLI